MKIIFAGSGEFAVPASRALPDAGHEIVLMISQPDRPAGRGRHLSPTPLAKVAIDRDFPMLRTANINQESLPTADLMVVIAFGQKISPNIVGHARLGAINLHGSRLPKFRGAAPVNAAILAGELETGNSIIRLADRMDAGAILAQSSLSIGELETAGELHDRLAVDGARLLLSTIEAMQAGHATETPQDHSQASRAPKLSRDSSHIDWTRSATDVSRQIRGMYPWPGCHVRIIDSDGTERCRATLVRARGTDHAGAPGLILESGDIACVDGAVEIVEIQPEGKRPMPLAAFRNGHPWHSGMQIESL